MPFYTIAVTNTSNETTKINLYQMKNHDKVADFNGKIYEWNPSRLYAIMPTGEAVVVQYYTFGKLLRPAVTFMKPPTEPPIR